ncbi:MAG: nucleoside hydrolase [Chthoniobacterales bacterium]
MRLLIAFLGLLLTCPAGGATAVWIDTDPAIGAPWREVDDAFALVLAFHSPELWIHGISTTYGNAALRRTTAVARELVRRCCPPDRLRAAEVHPGAASPRDLDRRTDATEALARALRQERLTYVALGPLTNLAAFLQLHPELAGRIERVIFVGGRRSAGRPTFGRGGWLRIHDANVCKDPAATGVLLRSAIPLTLLPVELARDVELTRRDLRQLRGDGGAGDFLYENTRTWFWFWTTIAGEAGGLPFDLVAVLSAIRPGLVPSEAGFARIDRDGDLVAGRVRTPGSRPVRFGRRVRAEAKQLLAERWRNTW